MEVRRGVLARCPRLLRSPWDGGPEAQESSAGSDVEGGEPSGVELAEQGLGKQGLSGSCGMELPACSCLPPPISALHVLLFTHHTWDSRST